MSGGEVVLLVLAILVPLAIAVAVTLWTLQPAVLRAERARRSKRRAERSAAAEREDPPPG